ncbi:hypothetical protein J1605_020067 [Eschrichtius robustus]|uniref:Uncharacterized protein n=1 Tax=Eschrichtius robustus TaxID=9764 RepID=A0AB34HMJ6_ESCRO|nr:hypothetical protein J1605_020067 [Eschrichtius robustus]
MAAHEWDWFQREELIGQISDIRVQNLQAAAASLEKFVLGPLGAAGQGPSQGNGGGPAVDLFGGENVELRDVDSLRPVAPTSLEPHGVELRLEAALQRVSTANLRAQGSSCSPSTNSIMPTNAGM